MKQVYDKQEQAQQDHAVQRFLLPFYFLYIAAATLLYAVVMARNFQLAHDWAMEDWPLNYPGGFVRRGLIGAAALSATPFTPAAGMAGAFSHYLRVSAA